MWRLRCPQVTTLIQVNQLRLSFFPLSCGLMNLSMELHIKPSFHTSRDDGWEALWFLMKLLCTGVT